MPTQMLVYYFTNNMCAQISAQCLQTTMNGNNSTKNEFTRTSVQVYSWSAASSA